MSDLNFKLIDLNKDILLFSVDDSLEDGYIVSVYYKDQIGSDAATFIIVSY